MFYVSSDHKSSILGIDGAIKFKLIPCPFNINVLYGGAQEWLNKYQSIFIGIGKVNIVYKITFGSDAIPKVSETRKKVLLKQRVKDQLDKKVHENLIVLSVNRLIGSILL